MNALEKLKKLLRIEETLEQLANRLNDRNIISLDKEDVLVVDRIRHRSAKIQTVN